MFDFDIRDGVLVWYKGEEESVVIPPEVRRIGVGAFKDSELVRAELHEGITRIHREAFMNCFHLREIHIPDSVTRIDAHAFCDCKALESVRLPPRLESIRSGTFEGCVSLKSIVLPETVRSIGSLAFIGCKSLETINLPEGLEEIGEQAFRGCEKLTLDALPPHIKKLWAWPFYECPIKRLRIGGEIEELRDFMVPDELEILYAPGEKLDDYLNGLNRYDPKDAFDSPYHILEYGEGDRWTLVSEGDVPCLRRISI